MPSASDCRTSVRQRAGPGRGRRSPPARSFRYSQITRLSKSTVPSSVISVGTLPSGLWATIDRSRLTGFAAAGQALDALGDAELDGRRPRTCERTGMRRSRRSSTVFSRDRRRTGPACRTSMHARAVAVLELAAAAARARIVASDLGGLAVASGRRGRVTSAMSITEMTRALDRLVEIRERQVAIERRLVPRKFPALGAGVVGIGREMAQDARSTRRCWRRRPAARSSSAGNAASAFMKPSAQGSSAAMAALPVSGFPSSSSSSKMTGSNGSRAAMYAASSLWRRMISSMARCVVAASPGQRGLARPCASKTKGSHAERQHRFGLEQDGGQEAVEHLDVERIEICPAARCRSSSSSETSASDSGAVSAVARRLFGFIGA